MALVLTVWPHGAYHLTESDDVAETSEVHAVPCGTATHRLGCEELA